MLLQQVECILIVEEVYVQLQRDFILCLIVEEYSIILDSYVSHF